jgi:hypothetical protein
MTMGRLRELLREAAEETQWHRLLKRLAQRYQMPVNSQPKDTRLDLSIDVAGRPVLAVDYNGRLVDAGSTSLRPVFEDEADELLSAVTARAKVPTEPKVAVDVPVTADVQPNLSAAVLPFASQAMVNEAREIADALTTVFGFRSVVQARFWALGMMSGAVESDPHTGWVFEWALIWLYTWSSADPKDRQQAEAKLAWAFGTSCELS